MTPSSTAARRFATAFGTHCRGLPQSPASISCSRGFALQVGLIFLR